MQKAPPLLGCWESHYEPVLALECAIAIEPLKIKMYQTRHDNVKCRRIIIFVYIVIDILYVYYS